MTKQLTKAEATAAARHLMATYIKPGLQWADHAFDLCLPNGWEMRPDAAFMDPPTVPYLAEHIRREARPRA